jgi:uncharacterized protein DUF2568
MRVSISEALRFLLELVAVVALAYWGVHASSSLAIQVLLAVGAPAALIVVWALFVAPRAVFPMPRLAQAIVGGLLLEIAAAAVVVAGLTIAGIALGIVIVLDTAVLALAEVNR